MTQAQQRERLVLISFVVFIGLGLTSGLLGLAWPSMRDQFGLALDAVSALYLVQTVGYTIASFSIARLMVRWGSGAVLLLGSIGATLCFFGISISATWLAVIAFSFVFGLGSGILDAGLNLYLAAHHTARQMSWLHACFGIGITLGPLIMTFVLGRNLPWQSGYALAGLFLIPIVLLIAATRKEWLTTRFQSEERKPVSGASMLDSLKESVVWLSMLTFLIYVGIEIGVGQWIYVLLTESRGVDPGVAGPWTSAYWAAFTGGRILFGFIADRFQVRQILRFAMMLMIVGAFLLWWNPIIIISFLGLVMVGFGQAPVFPMLMSDTPARVGAEHAANAISLQMGSVGIGTAVLPGLIGMAGDRLGLESMAASFILFAVLVFMTHELTRLQRTAHTVAKPST